MQQLRQNVARALDLLEELMPRSGEFRDRFPAGPNVSRCTLTYPIEVMRSPDHLGGSARGNQLGKVVVDTGDAEIRLALERPAHIVNSMVVTIELHDRENEVVRLVERVEDFVFSDGDGRGTGRAPLDLDEAQTPGAGDAAFNVVAELLELPIGRLEAKTALDSPSRSARARAAAACVSTGFRERWRRRCPVIAAIRPAGTTSKPAEHDRRQRRNLPFELDLFHALFKPAL